MDKYQNLKNAYNDYCRSSDKSDYTNTVNRFVVERNLVKQLIDLASEAGNDFDVLVWNKKFDDINAKLKEFGIEIND